MLIAKTLKTITTFCTITIACSCGVGEAENSAKAFAAKHFPQNTGVECMGSDSDGDGYASCTVFLPDDAIGIECATERATSGCNQKGCRIATGKSR